jgi:hypothetical protein
MNRCLLLADRVLKKIMRTEVELRFYTVDINCCGVFIISLSVMKVTEPVIMILNLVLLCVFSEDESISSSNTACIYNHRRHQQ